MATRRRRRRNPLRSGKQFRLAEAVAHGTARYPTRMSKRVARELIAKTPARLRSKLARENPRTIPARVMLDEKTGKVRVFVNPRHLQPKAGQKFYGTATRSFMSEAAATRFKNLVKLHGVTSISGPYQSGRKWIVEWTNTPS